MEQNAKPIFVYVCCPSLSEARKIAGSCVEKRLAVSGNILTAMETVYWWEGQMTHRDEVVLILKTMDRGYQALEDEIKTMHSYECPCICAFPITHGNAPYLDWMDKETIR